MTLIPVAVGTDVYGAVRSVERTPIVTKFAMVQFLPIFPVGSYYLGHLGRESRSGIPFVAAHSERAIIGIPCDQINILSVTVAYLRAVGAALLLVSTMLAFVFAIGWLCDSNFRFNDAMKVKLVVVGSALGVGLVVALPTYLFTVVVPTRERRIRSACARVLGIAADPANVKLEIATEIIAFTDDFLQQRGAHELEAVLCAPEKHNDEVLEMLLVRTRAQIRKDRVSADNETNSDRILQAIDDRTGS